MRKTTIVALVLVFAVSMPLVHGAEPPGMMNYQGVLRDDDGAALEGSFDMVFHLYDGPGDSLCEGGTLLLTDAHLGAGSGAVLVSGGLFNVALGTGDVTPGAASSLPGVFQGYESVYLQLTVEAEKLCPRVRVLSAGYALSADSLDGHDSTNFIDVSSATQEKSGLLIASGGVDFGPGAHDDLGATDVSTLTGGGSADGMHSHSSVGTADTLDGLDSSQFLRADTFDSYGGGTLTILPGGTLDSVGTLKAARLYDRDNMAYFADPASVSVFSTLDANLFRDGNDSSYWLDPSAPTSGLFAGNLRLGEGSGSDDDYLYFDLAGEYLRWHDSETRFEFSDDLYTARSVVAQEYYDQGNTNYLLNPAGTSTLYGVDINRSYIYVNADGPDATQTIYFYQNSSPSGAFLRWDDGNTQFNLSETLYISGASYGMRGSGGVAGGYFLDYSASGYGYIGYGDYGANCIGNSLGVRGYDSDSGTYAYLAFGSSSTYGSGAKNFVQNHPYVADQQIVYSAPEGNEVATYTRGKARLVAGEARVALDPTFAWVTNPDLGLTAHVTPRTPGAGLYVAELTTGEIVVRSDEGTDENAVFDFIVWGLRIGFEEISVVREKGFEEARIPSMKEHRERLVEHPEWLSHQPLERFRAMRAELGNDAPLDLGAAHALRAAIGEFDPELHGGTSPGEDRPLEPNEILDAEGARREGVEDEAPDSVVSVAALVAPSVAGGVPTPPSTSTEPVDETARSPFPLLEVNAGVRPGDLLAVDATGAIGVAMLESDAAVVGVAAGEAVELEGRVLVPVASFGVVALKVDASLGPIRVGDLLVSSSTPGHAMRAYADIPGTIIAKALEPLDGGAAAIRVLVTPR